MALSAKLKFFFPALLLLPLLISLDWEMALEVELEGAGDDWRRQPSESPELGMGAAL